MALLAANFQECEESGVVRRWVSGDRGYMDMTLKALDVRVGSSFLRTNGRIG